MSEIISIQDEVIISEEKSDDKASDYAEESENNPDPGVLSETFTIDERVDLQQKRMSEEILIGKKSLRFKALYDPGLEEAINYVPEPSAPYDNDGIRKYLDLTKALNIPVVKRFHQSLKQSSISLQYYGLQSRQMRAMTDGLMANTTVKEVNLEENILDLDSMYHLGLLLRENIHIKNLNLSGCMIGTLGAQMLGSGLNICEVLEYLNLSNNALGDEGFEVIAPSFGYNMSVRTLILSHNNLTHKSGFKLADMMEENISIQNLNLSWNEMCQEPGIKKFLSVTGSENKTLLNLNMSWNGLQGEKIAGYFRQFLSKHKGIQALDISNNRFEGDNVTSKLARGISQSETLRMLKLGFNPITEMDAFTLLSGISLNCPLRHLNLEYVWVNKEFNQLRKQAQNRGLQIEVGGVFEGKDIKGPDMQKFYYKGQTSLVLKPRRKTKKILGGSCFV